MTEKIAEYFTIPDKEDIEVPKLLFIVSGPSGVGKATLIRNVIKKLPNINKVITYTTRRPRPNEKDGEDYHFIGEKDFMKFVESNDIFEYEKVYGDFYYGSPSDVFSHAPEENDVILELDPLGMQTYKENYDNIVTMFIAPPHFEEIISRINKRAPEKNIMNRLKNAMFMLNQANNFDYVVVNDDLDASVQQMIEIINVERLRRDKELEVSKLKVELDRIKNKYKD